MVLDIKFEGHPTTDDPFFSRMQEKRNYAGAGEEEGKQKNINVNELIQAKPIMIPIQINSEEILHKIEISTQFEKSGGYEKASKVMFTLPIEDKYNLYDPSNDLFYIPHKTLEGDWFINRMDWMEGEEARITLFNNNKIRSILFLTFNILALYSSFVQYRLCISRWLL